MLQQNFSSSLNVEPQRNELLKNGTFMKQTVIKMTFEQAF